MNYWSHWDRAEEAGPKQCAVGTLEPSQPRVLDGARSSLPEHRECGREQGLLWTSPLRQDKRAFVRGEATGTKWK